MPILSISDPGCAALSGSPLIIRDRSSTTRSIRFDVYLHEVANATASICSWLGAQGKVILTWGHIMMTRTACAGGVTYAGCPHGQPSGFPSDTRTPSIPERHVSKNVPPCQEEPERRVLTVDTHSGHFFLSLFFNHADSLWHKWHQTDKLYLKAEPSTFEFTFQFGKVGLSQCCTYSVHTL